MPHRYFILNKPYDMLSQFKGVPSMRMLGDLGIDFPEGTHPIGRLDNISEGLLILTTNKKVTRLLFQGPKTHARTYLVRVIREVSEDTLQQIRSGISIRIKGNVDYTTAPCEASIVVPPENLFAAGYSFREDLPHTWLRLSLTEGKFRQIRKMMKVIRHPVQRLIRVSIENLSLGDLRPGEIREVNEKDFFSQLNIEYSPDYQD
ncbi:pseudouridine synthase [Arundinibacter roseus]|uniref:Pseudouridine synthase n=1 Tax=Arundinibacter roseus TaxID=2070510 RepID=A0A4R4K8N3_9BACT|nr:pseudouridine synthase [Arundinibacter roseus]TDB64077.1 rRNA pseudouridine synthase [Arundinibacter roseus]